MSEKFTLLKQEIEPAITEKTYFIKTFDEDGNEQTLIYKEWINGGGEVVDSVVRDEDGYEIDNHVLTEEIWDFINTLEQ